MQHKLEAALANCEQNRERTDETRINAG